ncbi:SMP-30/gluconolactonase/LRE family protein [Paramagnetospirillum magnetotacticum]|uniref:hypothetical protein n=1 Tax=Paramagnetospirillum magnetotacticum TaxID=188 RepID=UPI0012698936|nr:hypothetical protein [Paramagnetospirillum magnetotacticum]
MTRYHMGLTMPIYGLALVDHRLLFNIHPNPRETWSNFLFELDLAQNQVRPVPITGRDGVDRMYFLVPGASSKLLAGYYQGQSGYVYEIRLDGPKAVVEAVHETYMTFPMGLFNDGGTSGRSALVSAATPVSLNLDTGKANDLLPLPSLAFSPQGIIRLKNGTILIADTPMSRLIAINSPQDIRYLNLPDGVRPRQMVEDDRGRVFITCTDKADVKGHVLMMDRDLNLSILEQSRALLTPLPEKIHLEGIDFDPIRHKLYFAEMSNGVVMEVDIDKETYLPSGRAVLELVNAAEAVMPTDTLMPLLQMFAAGTSDAVRNVPIPATGRLTSYPFQTANNKLVNWESYAGRPYRVVNDGSEPKNRGSVTIETGAIPIALRPLVENVPTNSYYDTSLAGKTVVVSAWADGVAPQCVRVGFYRGNSMQAGFGGVNGKKGMSEPGVSELLTYRGQIDPQFTSSNPFILIAANCRVRLHNIQYYSCDSKGYDC